MTVICLSLVSTSKAKEPDLRQASMQRCMSRGLSTMWMARRGKTLRVLRDSCHAFLEVHGKDGHEGVVPYNSPGIVGWEDTAIFPVEDRSPVIQHLVARKAPKGKITQRDNELVLPALVSYSMVIWQELRPKVSKLVVVGVASGFIRAFLLGVEVAGGIGELGHDAEQRSHGRLGHPRIAHGYVQAWLQGSPPGRSHCALHGCWGSLRGRSWLLRYKCGRGLETREGDRSASLSALRMLPLTPAPALRLGEIG